MVWFSAVIKDVRVSPAHVRPFALAYLCPLTCVRVFSSSFAKILCRASSSYATVADPGSSTSFAKQDRIAKAVLCYEEALRKRCVVVPNA